jgi:hypothetical protein
VREYLPHTWQLVRAPADRLAGALAHFWERSD